MQGGAAGHGQGGGGGMRMGMGYGVRRAVGRSTPSSPAPEFRSPR